MMRRLSLSTFLGAALLSGYCQADDSKLIVRDVNVSFAAKGVLNDRTAFRGTLPAVVLSQRPVPPKPMDASPQPVGVITFEGAPQSKVDVLLEYDASARMLARWPHVDQRSTRTLWRNLDLVAQAAPTTPFPTNSWLTPLRQSNRLGLSLDKRNEKFVLYDMTVKTPNSVELEATENGYKARNFGTSSIHDVVVYRPAGDGKYRAATVAQIPGVAKPAAAPDSGQPTPPAPAAQPAPSVVTQALRAVVGGPVPAPAPNTAPAPAAAPAPNTPQHDIPWLGEPQTPEELIADWEARLTAVGLGAPEIAHVRSILLKHAFDKDSARVVFRIDPATIETLAPLEVSPQPEKVQRVWIVILDGADPEIKTRIGSLIAALGDNSYEKRMAARAELLKLGPTAVPQLNSEKSNKDPEIGFRIEEILEEVQNPSDQPADPNAPQVFIEN